MATPRQVRPGWDYGYIVQGSGIQKGVALVIGATNLKAKIASSIGEGRFRGVALTAGRVPNGEGDPAIPDMVTAQKQGIAQAMVPSASSATEGDQAICDADGFFIKRTPFTFSAFLWGQFDETFTAGASDEWRGVELLPQYVETVRNIFASNPTASAIGAATRYMAGINAALSASEIAIAQVQHTGQVLRNLKVQLATAPGGADTVVVTFIVSSDGGATWGALASAPTCTITGAALTAKDYTTAKTLTEGQLLGVKLVSSAGTAAGASVSFDLT